MSEAEIVTPTPGVDVPNALPEPVLIVGANTYLTLNDANTIAATCLANGAWANALDNARIRALITATSLLDRLRYTGRKLAPTQTLSFPRVSQATPPGYPLTTEIPAAVEQATVELALHLLENGEPSDKPVQSQMLGDSMVMFFPTVADELPKRVRRLVAPYLETPSTNTVAVAF